MMELWQTKLAARIHDPAEKALVLLRDPSGHEGGTVRALCKALFGAEQIPAAFINVVKQADRWASAADRPQFPVDADNRYVQWAQVNFAENPELIHPLTGEPYLTKEKFRIDPAHIKAVSLDHFTRLIMKDNGQVNWQKTLAAFWRFGPDTPAKELGALWSLLPADTRIPDHTIWQHLDLASAFAGAMTGGDEPALLIVSIGPVQGFIAAARTTSDLWAGSHLLSCIAWAGMKVICERFGPDAVIFPQLRGVPLVDVWLKHDLKLPGNLFAGLEWQDQTTDNNPLFSAALPNKFVALVPMAQAQEIAEAVTRAVRTWVKDLGRAMLEMLLEEIVGPEDQERYCHKQLEDQLKGFPEVHWAAVPWLEENTLAAALRPFYPSTPEKPGYLGSKAWSILKEPIEPELDWKFFSSNAGTLYPAVYELAERVLASAKSVRTFEQLPQQGYRDSLTGEAEWLTLDMDELKFPPGQRTNTLWARVANEKAAWARKGEHLSALSMMKRLWPNRFRDWLKEQHVDVEISRYVVSTHTMALAPSLERLLKHGPQDREALVVLAAQCEPLDGVALPRGLMRKWHDLANGDPVKVVVKRLPALLDKLREDENAAETKEAQESARRQREQIEEKVEKALGAKPERYYALILMDGDHMGAWLAGNEEKYQLEFRQTFHKSVRAGVERFRDESLQDYLKLKRPASPARHMAISSALNGFSLYLARHIVEDLCKGKLLYSGGDDVMAMVAIDDLLKCLWLLRLIYSGGMPLENAVLFNHDMDIAKGFVRWKDRLYRIMGKEATASVGAVIAHHNAPLGMVLRELRTAEKTAKNAGRNAFIIKVMKRAGGMITLTLPWYFEGNPDISPMAALKGLCDGLAEAEASRRVAYLADEWLKRLPVLSGDAAMETLIATNLVYQFGRQKLAPALAQTLAKVVVMHVGKAQMKNDRAAFDLLRDMLFVAEFLAREGRSGESTKKSENSEGQEVV